MQDLKVSIGIPTYNRSEYLIRAVRSALEQTYTNIEIVVSDNASTDDTAERVAELTDPRIVFLRQTVNLGMTGNFNACLNAATGDLFLMLSDDDFMAKECVEALSKPFRQDPASAAEVGVVWCPAVILDYQGNKKYNTDAGPQSEPGWALVEGLFRGTRGPRFCSIMVRRVDAIEVGGYRIEFGNICDVGNWSQIAIRYPKAVCIPTPLSYYTVHQASETSIPNGKGWQSFGERITETLVSTLLRCGNRKVASKIKAAGKDNTSNLIVTVMMQFMGKPGWIKYWLSELIRSPKSFLRWVIFRRLLKDGWKLLRMRS